MDKIKITLALGSPIISNGGYLTLDALLAALIFDESGDLEKAHSSIPLANTDGLWHASAAFIEKVHVERHGFVANLRASHDLDPNHIAKGKGGLLHRTMGLTRRSDFGAVMNSYKVIMSPTVTWYAQGDAGAVEKLLAGVTSIGKRRASGYGAVASVSVEEGDLDGITGFFGEPLRPVPVDLRQGFAPSALKADAAWRPAYWHPANRAVCFVPEMAV